MRLAILLAIAACEKSESPVRPEPVPAPMPPPVLDGGTLPISACYTVVVRIDRDGTWIGAPTDVRCFKAGAPDTAWIEKTAKQLRERIDVTCHPAIELGAATGITYAQIVKVFAAVRTAGFGRSLDFVEPNALAMTFDASQRAPECAGMLDTNKNARKPKPKRPPPPPMLPAPPTSNDPLTYAQVIRRLAISRDAIFLNGQKLAGVDAIAKALGPADDDNYSVILSPDASIDGALLHRIVDTLENAGYDHIAFETAP